MANSSSRNPSNTDNPLEVLAPHPYHSMNADGEIITVNDAWLDTLGYDRDVVEGQWFGDFLPNISKNEFESMFRKFKDKGHVSNLEYEMECADGEIIAVSYDGTIEYDDDGKFLRTHCQFTEITERRRREQELRQFKQAVEGSTDLLGAANKNEDILFINEQYRKYHGLSGDGATGKSLEEVLGDETYAEIKPYLERVYEGEKVSYAMERPGPDGDPRTLDIQYYPIRDENGDIYGSVTAMRDITEQKERERELELFKQLIDQSNDEVYVTDAETGIIQRVNQTACDHLGYSEEELVGMTVPEISDEIENVDEWVDTMDEVRRQGGAKIESVHTRADGTTYPVEASTSYVELNEGTYDVAIIRDITERKEREEEITRLKERLELAVEGANLGVWDWDMTTDDVEFNEQWAQMLGYSLDDIDSTLEAWEKRVHPEDIDDVEATLDAHIAGKTDYYDSEHRLRTAGGDWKWIRDVGKIFERNEDGDPIRAVGIHLDINERKKRERELRELKERYQSLVEYSSDIVTVADEDGTITHQNPAVERILGIKSGSREGDSVFEYVHPDDRQKVLEEYEKFLSDESESTTRIENRYERADGGYQWLESIAVDRTNTPIDGYVIYSRDITERKERENELRDLYQTYRDLFDGINDAVFVHEPEGTFLEVNEEAIDRHGYDEDELLELTPEDIDAPDHAPHAADRIETIEEKGTHTFESVHVTKSGDRIPVDISASIIDYFGDSAVLSVARDITERKEYEEELKQANDQLQVLNRILRHDIRNDMNIVLGWGEELEEHVDEDGEQMLNRIQDSSRHVIDLTKILRDFMKVYRDEEAPELTPVDIGNSLDNEIRKIQEQYSSAVVDVPDELPHIKVRANELITTVFWNLLQNAIKHNDKEVPRIEIGVEENEETVTFQVADNGPGIPEEQRETIFGKGESGLEDPDAGIGLYLADTVVTQYGGDVWVEENEPEGAKFVVELPKADSEG